MDIINIYRVFEENEIAIFVKKKIANILSIVNVIFLVIECLLREIAQITQQHSINDADLNYTQHLLIICLFYNLIASHIFNLILTIYHAVLEVTKVYQVLIYKVEMKHKTNANFRMKGTICEDFFVDNKLLVELEIPSTFFRAYQFYCIYLSMLKDFEISNAHIQGLV